ncbi:magnesium transporter protection protein MgtU [Salmonella enterica subsp. enterica serovar Derby]|nr:MULTISPECIES: magnesium transporter protection protein MgtU [Salmonella]MDR5456985.1 magnesium transporter protection protein MgtU [Salmonella enterica subsp. enterica serovar Apeyeme]WGN09244.1 magnesium transporter protection protein MgtU [Salmonella enterica subsp. enterica serovar Reading]MCR2294456.1 magnesium transporter protection protein MgtU [Salmonella enterica]MCR2298882.1 magnesium transporter protection protein MgtU [Salmonella enterica]MCR2321181.1 magnesium transporter protec
MQKKGLDKIFYQVVLIAIILILLTIWIR